MQKRTKPNAAIKLDAEVIRKYLKDYGNDGHAILDPEALLFYGFPEAFLALATPPNGIRTST